ncbi:MAG TPA: CBS domain-containing protein [Pyrinomonadaceae bacterium]|nr:CBS domain-containing protein [Pyrinomonadaceae bacterium]
MLVESLMTRDVEVCRPDSTLADAAAVMWRRDCGVVPVVEEGGRVVGVVTDRDICMALSMRGQRAAEVRVAEVLTGGVQTCTPVDDVREALEAMARRQVRRLPVVDSRGHLVGVLSINDIIRHTRKGKPKKRVSRRAALAALRAICAPHGSGVGADSDEAEREAAGEEHYDNEAAHARATEEAGGPASASDEENPDER